MAQALPKPFSKPSQAPNCWLTRARKVERLNPKPFHPQSSVTNPRTPAPYPQSLRPGQPHEPLNNPRSPGTWRRENSEQVSGSRRVGPVGFQMYRPRSYAQVARNLRGPMATGLSCHKASASIQSSMSMRTGDHGCRSCFTMLTSFRSQVVRRKTPPTAFPHQDNVLGTGKFSTVYLCTYRDNPDRRFALKAHPAVMQGPCVLKV